MHKSTVTAFRKFHEAQEAMLRAVMPRTAAACPAPLPPFAAGAPAFVVARQAGTRLVRPLTFTMQEAFNA